MWHHRSVVRPQLRRIASSATRPVGAALDRRFDALERRILDRLALLEERVGVEVETAAELSALQRRAIERLERRLETIEEALAQARDGSPGRGGRRRGDRPASGLGPADAGGA